MTKIRLLINEIANSLTQLFSLTSICVWQCVEPSDQTEKMETFFSVALRKLLVRLRIVNGLIEISN